MPNRVIKESICTSDTLDHLSADEERFFYRLLVQVDDFGGHGGRVVIASQGLIGAAVPDEDRRAQADQVTVLEAAGSLQPLAVQVGAVVGAEVFGDPPAGRRVQAEVLT